MLSRVACESISADAADHYADIKLARPYALDENDLWIAATARALGAEILGSTMSGYTGGPVPQGPDLELVAAQALIGGFVVAEGRYHVPALAAQAISAGADAVVAGSAITRTEHVTSWFVDAIGSTLTGGKADDIRGAKE